MVFCNRDNLFINLIGNNVTILILIDGFLQYEKKELHNIRNGCHNPYFNRWFSAIGVYEPITQYSNCHNPYFNRWFSAIKLKTYYQVAKKRHNPYFNRWFSAIATKISQNFTFLCKKLVFSDSFCELYFTQPLYINYCTNYLNTFLLKLAKIKAIINII